MTNLPSTPEDELIKALQGDLASDPFSEARWLEVFGRRIGMFIDAKDGSNQSKMKYFLAGLNETLRGRGYPTLEIVGPHTPRPKQMSFSEKLVFNWNRFLYKRGWKKRSH